MVPTLDPVKRTVLLDAALELFEERTFFGTAVPEVATRAGLATGTVYRYFADKRALANELYRDGKRLLASYLEAPPGLGPRAEFAHYWSRLTDFALEHPRELAFLELQQHQPYLDDESRDAAAAIDAALAVYVRRGQRARLIRPGDPGVLVALVFGAFVGLVRVLRAGGRVQRRILLAQEDAVWRLIAHPDHLTRT